MNVDTSHENRYKGICFGKIMRAFLQIKKAAEFRQLHRFKRSNLSLLIGKWLMREMIFW